MARTRRDVASPTPVAEALSSRDILSHVFSHLPARDYVTAAATSTTFQAVANERWLLASLDIGTEEARGFSASRQSFLRRLGEAGNGQACYRLAMAFAYHPHESQRSLEDSISLLERAITVGDDETRADAAYELWLLKRRSMDDAHRYLVQAVVADHRPARFAAHRSRSSARRPGDFNVSRQYEAAQLFLLAAQSDVPLMTSRFSVCQNPACGRWGVRAREVRRRYDKDLPQLEAPPGLPRCQGIFGMLCRTRYCSRYCQAVDWPKHREECGAHGEAQIAAMMEA